MITAALGYQNISAGDTTLVPDNQRPWYPSGARIERLEVAYATNDLLHEIEIDCSSPDWDGKGTAPITRETIAAARHFRSFLVPFLRRGLAEPHMAPGADGTIGFEWRFRNGPIRKLFVEIGPQEVMRSYWVKSDGVFEKRPIRMLNIAIHQIEPVIEELAQESGGW